MPFCAAEAMKRRTKSASTGCEPTRKRPRSAIASGVSSAVAQRADPLPRALDRRAARRCRRRLRPKPRGSGSRRRRGSRRRAAGRTSGCSRRAGPARAGESSCRRARPRQDLNSIASPGDRPAPRCPRPPRRAHGLPTSDPVVLRDLTNLIVHLRPAPVVARVQLTLGALRGLAWARAEIDAAHFLAAAGAPVAPPARDVDPGPARGRRPARHVLGVRRPRPCARRRGARGPVAARAARRVRRLRRRAADVRPARRGAKAARRARAARIRGPAAAARRRADPRRRAPAERAVDARRPAVVGPGERLPRPARVRSRVPPVPSLAGGRRSDRRVRRARRRARSNAHSST